MSGRKSILLVDDDIAVREALGNALETENYHVLRASNGEEAMREFLNNEIDIALLDLNLGSESGWDIFRQLTNVRPLLSTIIISAEPGRFSNPLAPKVDALMEKPLNLSILFNTLNQFASESAESRSRRRETSAVV
ncbi:MAG: response regulator [Verrucomicrobiota bacterium]